MGMPRRAAAGAQSCPPDDAAGLDRPGRSRIQALRRFYGRGKASLDDFPKWMGYGRVKAAEDKGVSGEMLRKSRQLAASYTREKFDHMLFLAERQAFPLGVSHVVRFLTVPWADRGGFAGEAIAGRWSKRRIDFEIYKRYGNGRPAAGRSCRVGGDAADACYQLVHFCEQWRRLYDALLVRGGGRAGEPRLRDDLSAGLRRRLRAADDALDKVESVAAGDLENALPRAE